MLRLQGLGSITETGVPYRQDEIMAIIREGKHRGNLPGVGRVLPGQGTDVLSSPPPRCTHPADVEKLKKCNKLLTKQFGSGSRSGKVGDDELCDDEDGGEDDEDADS
ncbi:hypothetical protein Tco_1117193 [Tanacetum coccineum]